MADHSVPAASAAPAAPVFWGYAAEFDSVTGVLHAAEQCRDAGFTRWDVLTPFPVHGLNDAMGLRSTRLPWFVFAMGATGCLTGVLMQWWMNAVDYRLIVSGKPFWSLPANIPVAFELTILFAALSTFFGMWFLNGLPRHYHPTFNSRRLKRATTDRFYVVVEATDPRFDRARTREFLESLGAAHVEELED
jgi:hypothetical protein